ncbi:MAG: PstC family ABC transporter permease [Dehalococcoidales bacterium]
MQNITPSSRLKKAVSWLKIATFILAIIPLAALLLIILNLVLKSHLAVTTEGWKLFSNSFDAQKNFGLLPALWGTFLVTLLAMLIATPIALMLAIIATDFSFGFVSNIVRWTIGVLSGIPPIIYAMMSITFVDLFILPKFAGQGLSAASLPPPTMLPIDGSSLLGSILLALLIVPIMAPLMDDAIQNVPHSLKEASLSLGADRWHTLTAVTLPSAMSGIGGAVELGILTALGETIIVAYAVGFMADNLPAPIFDILQRVAPLTSTIAGVSAGNFTRAEGNALQSSVSNFIALLLLVMAFVILGIATYIQRRLNKRLSP